MYSYLCIGTCTYQKWTSAPIHYSVSQFGTDARWRPVVPEPYASPTSILRLSITINYSTHAQSQEPPFTIVPSAAKSPSKFRFAQTPLPHLELVNPVPPSAELLSPTSHNSPIPPSALRALQIPPQLNSPKLAHLAQTLGRRIIFL